MPSISDARSWLLDAYLAEVVTLPELDRKRQDLTAATPPCSPSSASWTPRPCRSWNSAPSPTGSRHSARPSGPG